MQSNLENTLEQIENDYWGDPTFDSHLVTTCHRLRKKPLKDFSVEDLRILIGQNISLEILIPLAIEHLNQNIMAEGDLYPGDLLKNVLSSDYTYWANHQIDHRKLIKLFKNNQQSIKLLIGQSITKEIYNSIGESFDAFCKINGC